jgi:hypothetical protein
MLKLNLGGNEEYDGGPGSPKLDGFINVDARKMEHVHVISDIRSLPTKWIGQAFEIRASHVIEHLPYEDALEAVKHWATLLCDGGLLRIYCPDARRLAEDLIFGAIDMTEFSRNIYGKQTYDLNVHRAAYDQGRLNSLVEGAGLKVVGMATRPFAYKYDLGVQATKVGV